MNVIAGPDRMWFSTPSEVEETEGRQTPSSSVKYERTNSYTDGAGGRGRGGGARRKRASPPKPMSAVSEARRKQDRSYRHMLVGLLEMQCLIYIRCTSAMAASQRRQRTDRIISRAKQGPREGAQCRRIKQIDLY